VMVAFNLPPSSVYAAAMVPEGCGISPCTFLRLPRCGSILWP
jgi:hypothetical protein